jgi:hypothetical protein
MRVLFAPRSGEIDLAGREAKARSLAIAFVEDDEANVDRRRT